MTLLAGFAAIFGNPHPADDWTKFRRSPWEVLFGAILVGGGIAFARVFTMNRRNSASLVAWGGQTAAIGLGALVVSLMIRGVDAPSTSQISFGVVGGVLTYLLASGWFAARLAVAPLAAVNREAAPEFGRKWIVTNFVAHLIPAVFALCVLDGGGEARSWVDGSWLIALAGAMGLATIPVGQWRVARKHFHAFRPAFLVWTGAAGCAMSILAISAMKLSGWFESESSFSPWTSLLAGASLGASLSLFFMLPREKRQPVRFWLGILPGFVAGVGLIFFHIS